MSRWKYLVVLAGSALLVGMEVRAAPVQRGGSVLTVAPFRGAAGELCAQAVADALSEEREVEPWTAELPSKLRKWSGLKEWFEVHRAEMKADIAILGTIRKQSFIVEAYDLNSRSLIGLTTIFADVRQSCALSPRAEQRLRAWARRFRTSTVETSTRTKTSTTAFRDEASSGGLKRWFAPAPQTRMILLAGMMQRTVELRNTDAMMEQAFRQDGVTVWGFAVALLPFLEGDFDEIRPLEIYTEFAAAFPFDEAVVAGEAPVTGRYVEASATLGYRLKIPATRFHMIPKLGGHTMHIGFRRSGPQAAFELPNASYIAASFGVGLEVPMTSNLQIDINGHYLWVLDGADVFSSGPGLSWSAEGIWVDATLHIQILESLAGLIRGKFLAYEANLANSGDGAPGSTTMATDRMTSFQIGLKLEV